MDMKFLIFIAFIILGHLWFMVLLGAPIAQGNDIW
jgi:hypothetical protein